MLSGVGSTLLIFFSTLIFSLPLGLLVAMGRMNNWAPFRCLSPEGVLGKFKPVQLIIKFLISILRGTPLMLQLIVWFYGPYYLFGWRLNAAWRVGATIVGFSINYAAYFAEIFRSGIQGIPNGQREAARVLGYNRTQTFFKIIFPQMCKRVLPPVTNEVITLVKDTSLAFVHGLSGDVHHCQAGGCSSGKYDLPLFVAGVFLLHLQPAGGRSSWVGLRTEMNYYQ